MSTYSYTVRHKNGWGTSFGPSPTHCHTCGAALPVNPPNYTGGSGYGCSDFETIPAHAMAPVLKPGESLERSQAHCYQCCANRERARMIEAGRATLYLDTKAPAKVSDWAGLLSFPVPYVHIGAHNMARRRYDVTFIGPDDAQWRGTQYGDNTQICHCRRIKGGKS